jgi:hypothetical protein
MTLSRAKRTLNRILPVSQCLTHNHRLSSFPLLNSFCATVVRQVLGAIAQFEKASAVAKLAAARKRKREREGRCEGRKPLNTTRPEVVALARKLRRRKPKGGQLSLRGVASELAARGFLNERGKPYAAKSVASMLL